MKTHPKTMVTKPQIQKINVLISKLGLKPHKEALIISHTNKRTTHISEMYFDEAKNVIQYLVRLDPDERKRSLILSLGYQCGMLYGETPEDKKMNIAKVNKFLLERGAVKKEMHKLNSEELIKVHRQFEAMVRNKQNYSVNKAVKTLLTDLGIGFSNKQLQ